MTSYGELQIAEFLGDTKHVSGFTDASNKGQGSNLSEYHALCVGGERNQQQIDDNEKPPNLFCGHIPKALKSSAAAAAAVTGKFEDITDSKSMRKGGSDRAHQHHQVLESKGWERVDGRSPGWRECNV